MILLKKGPFLAADPCEMCGGTIQGEVTFVAKDGNFGDISWACGDCGDVGVDVAGWEYADKNVKIMGQKYLPYKSTVNHSPCHGCGKLVIGGPLILFIGNPKPWGELQFCFPCAERLGILERMLRK